MSNGASETETAGLDIVFKCDSCAASLVVDAAAAGMRLNCQSCSQPTVVPATTESSIENSSEEDAALANLRRLMKENDSQRTEITSYINQLSIQLHRWQLRLQTLNERRNELVSQWSNTPSA